MFPRPALPRGARAFRTPRSRRICAGAFSGGATADLDFTRIDAADVPGVPPPTRSTMPSMEKTRRRGVVWCRCRRAGAIVGSWAALHEASDADAHGQRRARGRGSPKTRMGATCYSESPPGGRGGTQGPRGHRDQGRGCWWAPKDRVQDVKKLVERLKDLGRLRVFAAFGRLFRPWGQLRQPREAGPRFQVKRLKVKNRAPPCRCSCIITAPSTGIVVAGHPRRVTARRGSVPARRETSRPTSRSALKHRIEKPGARCLLGNHRGAVGLVSRRRRYIVRFEDRLRTPRETTGLRARA